MTTSKSRSITASIPTTAFCAVTPPSVTPAARPYTGKRAIRDLVPAAGRRLSTQLSHRPLGRRDADSTASRSTKGKRCWKAGKGIPATI